MKNYKYIGILLLSLSLTNCTENNVTDEIPENTGPIVAINTGEADVSTYVAIGASFSAGFTDGALFKMAQENSFPNILASRFGGTFNQPLMNDNVGGLTLAGNVIQGPRLYFNGAGPAPASGTPSTEITSPATGGPFHNFGIPGAKSFHLVAPGYGSIAGITQGTANPYFARMASSASTTVLADAMAQNPTFFTLSEIGGNDVLGYALSGGDGTNPITPEALFQQAFGALVQTLTSNGAKGVVGNVPYITSLAHFTTVPYNPVPLDAATAGQINTQLLGPVKQILTAFGQGDRLKTLAEASNNPLLIVDDSLTDLSAQIAGALQQAGVPAPQAQLMGSLYGQARHADSADLFVLPVSSIIGTSSSNVPAPFNTVGVTLPLEDKWSVTSFEQDEILTATDSYNAIIESTVSANPNLALVDFKGVLDEAKTGIQFGEYNMTTALVTGGIISLDGVHLTARGYAYMANKILEAMDINFGSNFREATGGLADPNDYGTNYPQVLPN